MATYNDFKSTQIRGTFKNVDWGSNLAHGHFDRDLVVLGDVTLGKQVSETIGNVTTFTNTGGNFLYQIGNVNHTTTPTQLSYLDATSSIQGQLNSIVGGAISGLDLKANLNSPTFTGVVGGITKNMIGLSLVENTADINKVVSTATMTLLDTKINYSLAQSLKHLICTLNHHTPL